MASQGALADAAEAAVAADALAAGPDWLAR